MILNDMGRTSYLAVCFMLLLAFPLFPQIASWDSYGGLSWDLSFNADYHTPFLSARASGPKSGLTYGFIYQVIKVDPHKRYCLSLWVSNVNMKEAGGRFGFREERDFATSSFKAATDLFPADGENDEDYGELFIATAGGWTNLVMTNTPDTTNRRWVKVGLRVSYTAGAAGLLAFFDDVRFYATDNSNVNLIQNGGFEAGWHYPAPAGSSEDYRIFAFPKTFTPKGYDALCSINLKVSHPSSRIRAELLSLDGHVKKVFYNDVLSGTQTILLWDGKDGTGNILPMGIYILRMRVLERADRAVSEKEYRSILVIGNNLR